MSPSESSPRSSSRRLVSRTSPIGFLTTCATARMTAISISARVRASDRAWVDMSTLLSGLTGRRNLRKSDPAATVVVVQLAGADGVDEPRDRPLLHDEVGSEALLEKLLRRAQAVERDLHVEVVGR